MRHFDRKFLIGFTLILLISGAFIGSIAGFLIAENDHRAAISTDTSVVLEGEREDGYPNTTFLFMQDTAGKDTVCGGVLINSNILLTAGHCIAGTSRVSAGTGHIITGEVSLAEGINNFFPKNWDPTFATKWQLSKLVGDIAVVELDSRFPTFAELATPTIGCGYEVTGYGTTYEEVLSGELPSLDSQGRRFKQSIELCITGISQGTLQLTPQTGSGLCYGDSGSPIYRKDTDEVVGVLSSVIGPDLKTICSLNNRALGVDITYHQDFLGNFADVAALSPTEDSDEYSADFLDIANKYSQNRSPRDSYFETDDSDFDSILRDPDTLKPYKQNDNTGRANDPEPIQAPLALLALLLCLLLCCISIFAAGATILILRRRRQAVSPQPEPKLLTS